MCSASTETSAEYMVSLYGLFFASSFRGNEFPHRVSDPHHIIIQLYNHTAE